MLFWLGAICIALTYLYLKRHYNYWQKRGVDIPKYYYIAGNLLDQFTLKRNTGVILQDNYKAYEGYNYFGFYNFLDPAIVVRNPEIIGDILMKDFASFAENGFEIDEDADVIFGKNPFFLKGERWKDVRAQSTPSFSSGKIKMMTPLINETSAKLVNYMKDHEHSEIDLGHLTRQITAENVASCAFGLEGGNFTPNPTQFINIAEEATSPSTSTQIKSLILIACPPLARIIKLGIFKKESVEYLGNIIKQTIKYREENNIQRNDLLDEMMRRKEKVNDEKLFSFLDILGHAGGFIVDGILTSAAAASHVIYNIAKNHHVQERLRQEIEDVLQNNELTYEKVQEMVYLDCVLKESLRQYPPLMFLTKKVTKPYTFRPMREDNTGPCVKLEIGTTVLIPAIALHMDDKYFPDPEKFEPERWMQENASNIAKHTYLPFGEGPRACLGMRFAILQIKIAIITMVRNYKLTVGKKTQEPVQIDPASFITAPLGGYWIEFTKF